MPSFNHWKILYICLGLALPVVCGAQGINTQQGLRFIHPNSTSNAISLLPPSSITSYTLTLPGTQGAVSSYLVNDGSGNLSWQTLSGSTALSSITAASATNSINSSNFGQTWAWNTLAGTSALTLSSTSTAAASNAQTLLNISLSGANATTTQTTYGMQVANTHTGTSSTNIAGYFSASGGSNNYGLLVANGNVGIGTTSPSYTVHTVGMLHVANSGGTSYCRIGGTETDLIFNGGPDQIFGLINESASGITSFMNGGLSALMSIHNASGNVGIGIGNTTPVSRLELKDGNISLTNTGTAGELRLYEPSASGNNYSAFKAQAQAADITYTLPSADGSSGQVLSTNGTGTLSWATAATASTAWMLTGNTGSTAGTNYVGTTDAQALVFKTNSIERARFTNGTVLQLGIPGSGATVPSTSYTLGAAGWTASSTSNNQAGSNTIIQAGPGTGTGTYGYISFQVPQWQGTATAVQSLSEMMRITTDKVLIGGASGTMPNYRLQIDANSGGQAYINMTTGSGSGTTTTDGLLVGLMNDNTNSIINNQENGYLAISTNATERMRILAGGGVGINTTSLSTGSTLDSRGHLALSNAGTASELRLYEPSGSGSNYTAFKAQAQAADLTYTLPAADGTSGHALTTNGSGTLSWAAVANSTTAWMRAGNAGTTPGTDFIGTTDAQDLMFKVSGTERLTLKQSTGFLHLNQTNQNTMMGYQVANASPTGGANTGIGYQALYNLTTGTSNVALGFVAMSANQTGTHNTALGTVALNFNTGSYNVGVGSWSGYWMTGSKNTVVGYVAGFNHTSGNQNIFIGDSTLHPSGNTGSNLMSIGNAIYGNNINTANPRIGIGAVSYASDVTLDIRGNSAISNSDNTAKELRFYEPSNSGLHYTAFKAQAQAANVTYTLPNADGTSGAQLQTNGSGTLSWSTIGKEVVKYKSADESVSSATTGTTLQNDDDLNFTVSADEKYMIDVLLDVTGSAGDIKVAFTLPSGTMALNMCANLTSGNTAHVHEWLRTSGTATSAIDITNNATSISIKGMISVGGTGGTVNLQWAQNSSNATATTVKTMSNMRFVRIE